MRSKLADIYDSLEYYERLSNRIYLIGIFIGGISFLSFTFDLVLLQHPTVSPIGKAILSSVFPTNFFVLGFSLEAMNMQMIHKSKISKKYFLKKFGISFLFFYSRLIFLILAIKLTHEIVK
jgi:hypothetical protein